MCQCPAVRHTSTREFQSRGKGIKLNLRHLSRERLRDKLIKSHPVLPLRERLGEAFQLSRST